MGGVLFVVDAGRPVKLTGSLALPPPGLIYSRQRHQASSLPCGGSMFEVNTRDRRRTVEGHAPRTASRGCHCSKLSRHAVLRLPRRRARRILRRPSETILSPRLLTAQRRYSSPRPCYLCCRVSSGPRRSGQTRRGMALGQHMDVELNPSSQAVGHSLQPA